MTTVNYLRMTKAVEEAERKLGGPLREILHSRLNEPGETVASISKEIRVQKATINYWMAKLGINYGRVAHYFDEEIRILSPADARLLDAVLEMGISADDLDDLNPEADRTMRRLEELGVPLKDLAELNASQVVALRRLARLGLTDEQIDLIDAAMLDALAKLMVQGVSSEDVSQLSQADIALIKQARSAGIDVDELSNVGTDWLAFIRASRRRNMDPQTLANVDSDAIGALERARDRGISLGAFLRESLEMALDSSTSRGATADPLFADSAVYEGEVPADLSEDHDKYLYGETSER